jgi:2-oxoisovalerate dehydrogenase E1 component
MSAIPAKKVLNKLDYLKLMLVSREGDRREGILHRQGKGWFQVSGYGHEALGIAAYALSKEDYIFPYYRDRAIALARGMTNYELALAYLAKRSSTSGGRQMPGHYSSREHNIFSVMTPTGAQLLPACGAAWGMKMADNGGIVLTTVGDAATRQGEFYEALAFAVQESLPVIFLIEDNKYGISTPTERYSPYNLALIQNAPTVYLNGRLPMEVYEKSCEAAEKARRGDGPTVLWCDIDRLGSHTSSDDQRVYRPADEISAMADRDPIKLFAAELIDEGVLTSEEFARWQQAVALQVDEDYQRADQEQDPIASETWDFNWGEETPATAPPIQAGQKMTMVQAINGTFRQALHNDPNVIFFGEDIEDPKGGVFGLTKGLKDAYPKQVYNSPLAEATIIGAAVGLAASGYRPVFEIQFIDFISPAWNQLVTNVSTLRWRSFGHWKCPMVIYAPYGAYLPGGSLWHSMSNEGMLAHITGIKIAIPSTPEDAAGLFWSAIHGDDPHFILVPKHIFRKAVDVKHAEPVPFGKAKVVRQGKDVTLISWGNCLELAYEAADQLAETVSVEVIDLRTIVPCDYETITKSVAKTGRMVVVHEDTRTCGFGQAILAEMTQVPERWNLFLSPPQLVAREDVPVGYNPVYEYAALPDLEGVVAAIHTVME